MKKVFNIKKGKGVMRILHIGMHNQLGGIESFMMNYYRNINRNRIQFDFIIPYKLGGYYDKEIESLGGKIFYLSIKDDKNIFKFCKELDDIFRKNNYNIVHCSDTGLGILYLYFAKKNNCKIRIAHSHATNVESGLKGFLKKKLIRKYIQLANEYFSCSTEAGEYLFGKNKFIIVNNGIDYDRFTFDKMKRKNIREKFNINENDILLGNIGRFCEQKNQIFLINLLKRLDSKYKLILIGEGPLKKFFNKIIYKNKLNNRVIILEPQKNVEDYYNAFDIFCLSSFYEGLPIVGIEAQVNGLPCIFSDSISRELKMNKNCIFLKNEEPLWIESIVSFNRREKNISNKFNIKKNACELEDIYNNLIKKYEVI